MNNELEKEDYEQLLLLIRTSESIFNLYIELAKLEIINKKETKKYEEILENLKTYLKLEKEILSRINPLKLYTLIEEVSKQIGCIEATYEDIDIIVGNKRNILPLQRVSKKLKEYVISIFSNCNIEFESDNCETQNEELNFVKKAMLSSAELIRNIENDKWSILISLLDTKISNTTDIELKSKLIRSKYYLSYLIPQIENNLIKNNFIPPHDIFFNTDLTASLYNVSSNVLYHQKEGVGEETYNEEIKKLLKIKNENFEEKELEIIIRTSLLRVAFQFLETKEVETLNENFKRKTENNPNLKGYEKVIEVIEESFKAYNQDKTLIKKVTLGN